MKRKNEKVPGFDEIIFENRNKEYGAYDLRKKNLPATFFSMIGGVALFSAIIISVALGSEKKVNATEGGLHIVTATFDNTIPDLNKLKPDVPALPKFNINAAPVVVAKLDTGDIEMVAAVTLDTTKNKPVDVVTTPNIEPVNIVPSDPEPLVIVQEMPEFPGGNDGIMKFINDNIKYPPAAVDNGVEGKVILRFVVSTDGSVRRIEILRSVDPVLDQEAIRVISKMPKWKPGKNNGTPAAVWFSVPVFFKIKKGTF
jgi:protein TonB